MSTRLDGRIVRRVSGPQIVRLPHAHRHGVPFAVPGGSVVTGVAWDTGPPILERGVVRLRDEVFAGPGEYTLYPAMGGHGWVRLSLLQIQWDVPMCGGCRSWDEVTRDGQGWTCGDCGWSTIPEPPRPDFGPDEWWNDWWIEL